MRTSGATWRQLIKFERIDGCMFLNGMQSLPIIDAVKKYYGEYFPNWPQRCPIMPGKYSVYNLTVIGPGNEERVSTKHLLKNVSPKLFPNGVYRHKFHVYSEDSADDLTIYFDIKVDVRMNENDF